MVYTLLIIYKVENELKTKKIDDIKEIEVNKDYILYNSKTLGINKINTNRVIGLKIRLNSTKTMLL